jgi:hypothetical protein
MHDMQIDESVGLLKQMFLEQGSLSQLSKVIEQIGTLCSGSNQPSNVLGFLSRVLTQMLSTPMDGFDVNAYTRNICNNILSNSQPGLEETELWEEVNFPPVSPANEANDNSKIEEPPKQDSKPSIPTRPLMWSKIHPNQSSFWVSNLANQPPPELDFKEIEQAFHQKPSIGCILSSKRANVISTQN